MPRCGVVSSGLRDGKSLICARWVQVMTDALDDHMATSTWRRSTRPTSTTPAS